MIRSKLAAFILTGLVWLADGVAGGPSPRACKSTREHAHRVAARECRLKPRPVFEGTGEATSKISSLRSSLENPATQVGHSLQVLVRTTHSCMMPQHLAWCHSVSQLLNVRQSFRLHRFSGATVRKLGVDAIEAVQRSLSAVVRRSVRAGLMKPLLCGSIAANRSAGAFGAPKTF